MASATETRSATDTLAELTRKLDFWERNLRANYEAYAQRAEDTTTSGESGRKAYTFSASATGIHAQLGMIDSVRDVIDPGWSDR